MTILFVASINGEDFHQSPIYASRDEAIRALVSDHGLLVGDHVWSAEAEPFCANVSASAVIEQIEQDASDQCGEAGTDWRMDATQTQVDELDLALQAVLDAWVGKHKLHPTCYGVSSMEQRIVTEADAAAPSPVQGRG
jgi:hypothetical protein